MEETSEREIDKAKRRRTKKIDMQERSLLSQVLGDHGIPGVIAIGVIGTICFIAIQQVVTHQPIEIPKYFTELSSLIVGYYFGTHAGKKKASDRDASLDIFPSNTR